MADSAVNNLQEVTIESMPIADLSDVAHVETVDELVEGQPIVGFHSLPDQIQEEIVLQPQEEIVGEDQSVLVGDDGLVYIDSIPVPVPHNDIDLSPVTRTLKTKTSPKKQTFGRNQVILNGHGHEQLYADGPNSYSVNPDKKWEQKKFQIQTTDGEFSVTMWASGKYFFSIFFEL